MKSNVVLLIFIVLIFSAEAHSYYSAWQKARPLSIDLQYHYYDDLVQDPSNPKTSLNATLGVGLNLRLYRIFSLVGNFQQAADETRTGYGLGLRVDLPGFLFLGGVANDFVRRAKRETVNTYFQWTKLIINEENLDKYVADRMGFGVDIFILSGLYLNIEAMTYSHQGNQFIAPGGGIGIEF